MNLDAGFKNIHVDNNGVNDDEEKEAPMADEEEEDDDEPDFMDNSGKCWEFACKIRDEKHLKEWCQNKMGGIIVGKEEKLTRQFHCPNKECQFKAIFLKSCSIVYTRNNHNHGVKNGKNILQKKEKEKKNLLTSAPGQNYVDHYGKIWTFHAHIGKNISQDIFRSKFGFTKIDTNGTGLYLRCLRQKRKCKFAGIYLKSNGCLYTRGKHGHEEIQQKNLKPIVGDDYVNCLGKTWPFHSKIGKNAISELFRNKFGFSIINKRPRTLNLYCQKEGINGEKCPISGIYVKENGCLYIRGKHEHAIEKKYKPNIGDDYVDHHGKLWPFHSKIGKNISYDELLTKFGFSTIQQWQRTLNLHCQKRIPKGRRCPIKGIYLKSNGCLYIREKHQHK